MPWEAIVLGLVGGYFAWNLGTAHRKLDALGRAAGIRFHPLTGQQVGTELHRDGCRAGSAVLGIVALAEV